MNTHFIDLPADLQSKLMSLMREVDGAYKVTDMGALLMLIVEHADKYPQLLEVVKVKEGALEEHYEWTGEVPPGVNVIRTTREEGSNVVGLEVLRGPIPPRA